MHVTIVLGTSYATMRSVAFEFRGAAQRYAEGFIAERSVAAARLVLAATLLAMPAIARAGSETIALDDALRIAIARNPGLIATRVDAEIASDRVRSAKGAQDWILSSDATWNTSRPTDPAVPTTTGVAT